MNSFLTSLLNKQISNRICSVPLLKLSPLYKDFPWDDLIDFKVHAPFIPRDLREWSNNLYNFSNQFEDMLMVKLILLIAKKIIYLE